MENEIIAKEKGFIYKGNFYDIGDLAVNKAYYLVNIETGEEYGAFLCGWGDLSLEATYKIKVKYEVRKGFNTLETFETEDEAKHFIELATANMK